MTHTQATLQPETKLERHVAKWLKDQAVDGGYDSGIEGVAKDLFYGGCQSGMVGHLIYYHDTLKFYRRYKKDIHVLLKDMLDSCGGGISDLFGNKWDKDDPLADETHNQNLLAWFGFEEAARNLCDRAEMNV